MNCELLGKDGGHLAERMKVQGHHHLIELVGEIQKEFDQYCIKGELIRTVTGDTSHLSAESLERMCWHTERKSFGVALPAQN